MQQTQFKQYVLDNPKLVKIKRSDKFPGLSVLKYSKQVFYKGLWNPTLEWCRGTVVDDDFNLILSPVRKIYNFGIESNAPKINDDEIVTAHRKVNGFMVAMTYWNNQLLVSTTGSLDSEYVRMAEEMMLLHSSRDCWERLLDEASGFTLIFECVHPDDPHICPEKPGMYLLAHRRNSYDAETVDGFGKDTLEFLDSLANKVGCYRPEAVITTMGKIKEAMKTCTHEGYVIYTQDGRATKIKSQHYLVQKWVARNPDISKLWKESIFLQIGEEFHHLIYQIRQADEEYAAMSEQERLAWIRKRI